MEIVRGGPAVDPDQIVDPGGFVDALVRLRAYAGNPSYRRLAARVGTLIRPPREVPFRTVADVFQPGRRRLDLDLVLAVTRALGADAGQVEGWRSAFARAYVETKADDRPVAVSHQLPAALSTFTGRREQLKQLIDAAPQAADPTAAKTVVISAIEGMGGVGKTQLALHAAHHLVRSGRFADLQLYANLRGFDPEHPPADPDAVLDAFLRQLAVPARAIPSTRAERAAMFRDRLHGKHAIVLLDNAADENQVRDLIPASAGCLVFITSRRTLAGLDGAELHLLDVFDEPESIELLGRLAGRERVAAESEAAAEIARACGRLPLAVALAGARLRTRPTWTLADLATRLRESDQAALELGGRGPAAVFDLSYRQLHPDARRVFRLLGLCPGEDFTASAAAALVDGPLPEVERVLGALVDSNLLETRESGRYHFHDLLRAYARGKARQDETAEQRRLAVERVARWYLYACHEGRNTMKRVQLELANTAAIRAAARTDPPVAFTDHSHAVAWFDAERSNILAVVALCETADIPPVTWQLPRCLIDYYLLRAAWGDYRQAMLAGLAGARAHGDFESEGTLLLGQSSLYAYGDRPGEAIAAATRALALFEQIGSASCAAHAAVVLADAVALAGRKEESLPLYRKAVDRYRALGDTEGLGMTLNNLGYILYEMGRYREAVTAASAALEAARAFGTRSSEAGALDTLGQAYRGLGSTEQAVQTLRQAVEAYREVGDRYLGADALDHYGDALQEQGKTEESTTAWTAAALWFDEVSTRRAESIRQKIAGPDPSPGTSAVSPAAVSPAEAAAAG